MQSHSLADDKMQMQRLLNTAAEQATQAGVEIDEWQVTVCRGTIRGCVFLEGGNADREQARGIFKRVLAEHGKPPETSRTNYRRGVLGSSFHIWWE